MTVQRNSVLNSKTRYVSGGTSEMGQNSIEWWERNNFSAAPDDIVYMVEQKFSGRLDLIAALFLGDPHYWWVLAQYNNILDPFSEIVAGARIAIPSSSRLEVILSGKTGGIPSTREIPTTILPIV